MDRTVLKNNPRILTAGILIFFMAVTFLLRILPAITTASLPYYPVFDTDTWYNLRQIEVMVHNFPQYNWFDPLTAYPQGKLVDWGPLYPFLASVLCLLTGSVSQNAIVSTSGYVSPVLATFLVPVLYGLGSLIRDRATGLVAAGLVPVTSLLFFSFSAYGIIDHHVAEVFFTTLFFFLYLYGLAEAEKNPASLHQKIFPRRFIATAVLAGIVYFLGIITSTTVILTLLVIALYTLVQEILDFSRGKNSDHLCIQNTVMLAVVTALLLLFGFRTERISFTQYSVGIVYLNAAVVAQTLVLWFLAGKFSKIRSWYYLSIAAIGLGLASLATAVPAAQQLLGQAYSLLFGFSVYSVGVQETLPWSLANAYDTLNLGVVLLAGGFLVLGYTLWKEAGRELLFLAVWSVIMLFMTILHQRFLYYFTVNIMLLAAFCISEPLKWEGNIVALRLKSVVSSLSVPPPAEKPAEPVAVAGGKGSRKKKPEGRTEKRRALVTPAGIFGSAVCILAIVFVALSVQQDISYGLSAPERVIPDDWIRSLGWMKNSTPDPDIDYFGAYDPEQYTPPAASYGVLSVWDAGHWITFFAHRPAITNPFQDNLGGARGTAAFFLEENESRATAILKQYRGRYIITDSTLAVDRFTNLVPWKSGSTDISPYIKWFLSPDPSDPRHLAKTHKYDNGYFQTMVARLHLFDGSLTEPGTTEYVTYSIRLPAPGESADATGYARVITGERNVTPSETGNATPVIPEGPELVPTSYAGFFSESPERPVRSVPALQHYRLVHESETDASVVMFPESPAVTLPGIRMVKIFEYVKGARITGSGTIELSVVTNTGRSFTWRQESTGGEFVVPYATTGNLTEVHATGPYHISGTGQYFSVTEDDVTEGRKVKAA